MCPAKREKSFTRIAFQYMYRSDYTIQSIQSVMLDYIKDVCCLVLEDHGELSNTCRMVMALS